jgi:hypothetical protein
MVKHHLRQAPIAALGADHDPHIEPGEHLTTAFDALVETEERYDRVRAVFDRACNLNKRATVN